MTDKPIFKIVNTKLLLKRAEISRQLVYFWSKIWKAKTREEFESLIDKLDSIIPKCKTKSQKDKAQEMSELLNGKLSELEAKDEK